MHLPFNPMNYKGSLIACLLYMNSWTNAQPIVLPSTPQGKIVAAYIGAFNSGDEQAMRAFFIANVSAKGLADRPVEDRLQRYRQMKTEMGSLDVQKLVNASENAVTLVVKAKNSDRMTFRFEFDSKQSAKLAGIRVEMGEPDAEDAGPPMSQDELIRSVKKMITETVKSDQFSGVVFMARHGRTFFQQAYGDADKRNRVPNRIDTKFNLGSINKYFTRLAIGQLAEQNKLSFDGTLIKYLPDYPNPSVATKITINQLLEMTSGLGDFFGEKYIATPKNNIRTLHDYLPLFVNDSLLFEPGTQQHYSNAGFILLGLIIERVSGENYYTYMKRHVFTPAGMKNTDWYEMDAIVPNIATGYEHDEGQDSVWVSNIYSAPRRGSSAGGGYSTAEDLLNFVNALENGKLLSPRYTRWMVSGNLPKDSVATFPLSGGIGIAGGAPGINATLDVESASGFTTIVLSNYSPPSAQQIAKKIRAWTRNVK